MKSLNVSALAQDSGPIGEVARTFGVDWPHLIAQMISFSIVCAVLYLLAYKPILRMLAARREQITGGLANAAQIKAELSRIDAERLEVLRRADDEGQRLIEDARAAGARLLEDETQKALAASQQILAAGARRGRARARADARRGQARSGSARDSDERRGDRQDPDARGSSPPGGRDSAAARVVMAMKTKKRTRRAARLLFRLCVLDGVLDEARARHVAARLAASGRRGALPVAERVPPAGAARRRPPHGARRKRDTAARRRPRRRERTAGRHLRAGGEDDVCAGPGALVRASASRSAARSTTAACARAWRRWRHACSEERYG